MDKDRETSQMLSHTIQLTDRKSIQINGIKKIESFDKEEFFLRSVMGYLLVKGEELELIKLDTVGGTISIKGKINSLLYLEENGKKIKKESIVSRLFK